jgi:translocation and assembly module TamB
VGEPVLLGRSEASRGEIYFLGQRYDITSGKVDFVNPEKLEPFVDLTAETRVRSYRVELRLTGTPDRFYPELSSDPPLRTVDILRLLAGASDREILDTLVGNETEELAGVGVASLLTERLSQEVGKRAERLFGLDRFSVNPFLVGQFANPTARVSLGKQITRELAINYSTNLNATTEAIILIEYTPEGPMSWILSRDEEGDIGIDVKFRKSF